ncbi:aldo/keto reductase [Microbacter margulisiae]|uniref:Aryl-alcohol dehydrogenase-like predicted oxidoreductase n=1 Tax=Microbacter margulisiae TaxID=1350067 RepID=A0A7W5H1L8_9PORP|nr:aldo/keto reductase [Microbacter margulisiae]MBB3186516.1 aryl-alcohol dehydrogenase-like predicted oxidoreductase [Microbacter margulisiae]
MQYKSLGNTGLKVSELCLGTMTFGGQGMWTAIGTLSQKEVEALVKESIDAGINFIDTANVYSYGLSEQMTGLAIRHLGLRREELVIATKVRGAMSEAPNQSGLSRKHILHQVETSLERLQTDYIDLYQIHGFDPETPMEETLSALDSLVQSGKTRYIGCSNLAAWQIMKALGISAKEQLSKFISLQAYYTIAGRDIEREIVPLLKDQNMGLMVWSPLAGGFLSGKYTRNNSSGEGRRVNFDFPPINKEKAYDIIDVMQRIANEKNSSVAQIALAWLLHQPVVTSVIIGAKNQTQLTDNLKAASIKLTEKDLDDLNEVSKLMPEYPQWMIDRQSSNQKR